LAVFFNIHSEHSEKISKSGGHSSISHPSVFHSVMREAEPNIKDEGQNALFKDPVRTAL